MSKRIEGPCVIPICPGSGVKRGVTAIECDDPACGFSATVEHWVSLESLVEDNQRLVEIRNKAIIAKEIGDINYHGLTDALGDFDERFPQDFKERYTVAWRTTIEEHNEKIDARLDELEKFIKRVDSSVGDHDNRLDRLE